MLITIVLLARYLFSVSTFLSSRYSSCLTTLRASRTICAASLAVWIRPIVFYHRTLRTRIDVELRRAWWRSRAAYSRDYWPTWADELLSARPRSRQWTRLTSTAAANWAPATAAHRRRLCSSRPGSIWSLWVPCECRRATFLFWIATSRRSSMFLY